LKTSTNQSRAALGHSVTAATRLRLIAAWCIPTLTTSVTVLLFYLLSRRAPAIMGSVGSRGMPAVIPVAIAIIVLTGIAVLAYALIARRAEHLDKSA
jgi:hypothetical protein